MPYAPRPRCKHPLCPKIAEQSSPYCIQHSKQPVSQQEIDRHRHDNRVYGNTTWRRLRRIKLSNDPLCELCLSKDIVVQASQVDHIIPVAIQPELRLSLDNLQSLCETCHSKKTREENK
ncbi:MAG: HNH endonuclease signature motif containing protein [Candidatus Humimicrobiaceae bacterium]